MARHAAQDRSHRQASLALAALACACGGAGAQQQQGGSGEAHVRASSSAELSQGSSEEICATFAITPYSIGPDGSLAFDGAHSVTLHSTPAAEAEESILGCIDGPGYQGDNFGYLVTASAFGDCSTYTNANGTLGGAADPAQPNGAPVPGLSLSPVTFQKSFDCHAGIDNEVQLSAQVSIAQAGLGGYVDVYAGVSATVVEVGCKQADISAEDDQLHFAETAEYDAGQAPAGLIAIGYLDPHHALSAPAASSIAQFDGVEEGGGEFDAFYTGRFSPQLVPGLDGGSWDVLQTFAADCPAGSWFAAQQQPACDTSLAIGGAPDTQLLLADAVIAIPGGLWLVARIDSDLSGILLTSGAQPRFSQAAATTTAWNPETSQGAVLLGPPGTVAGVYLDRASPGRLQVAVQQSGSIALVAIDWDGAAWQAGTPQSLNSFSMGQLSALLVPVTGGCQEMP